MEPEQNWLPPWLHHCALAHSPSLWLHAYRAVRRPPRQQAAIDLPGGAGGAELLLHVARGAAPYFVFLFQRRAKIPALLMPRPQPALLNRRMFIDGDFAAQRPDLSVIIIKGKRRRRR